jgi:type I restriction enzyme, S subunit
MPSGYKQSEVGVIPASWRTAKMGEVCGFIVPGRNKPKVFDGDIPWITTPDIEEGIPVSTSRIGLCISRAEAKAVGSKIVPPGSILMSCAGELGIVALTQNEIVVNQQLHVFIPTERVDASFLLNVLTYQKAQIADAGTKTAVPYLNKNNCNSITIPLPPFIEQRAIAAALSDVDALLGGLDRLIAKKRDLKQAAAQQLLTGQTRLPGFNGEWQVKRLEKSCETITKGTTPTSIGRNFTESGVNFLKAESISEGGEPLPDRVAFIDKATHKLLGRSQLKEGDLLISIAGVLGRVGRVSRDILPANTNQALAIVRLGTSSELERTFLFYCLRGPMTTKQINEVNVQAAQANISLQNVRDLEIQVPPTRAEQTAIAEVLSNMDTELAGLEQRRVKTRDLKQAMMQELLTGRTRLV